VIDALLILAVLCGCAGAMAGDRVAWPLLVSLGICVAMDVEGVEFDAELWMLIDVLVSLAIVNADMVKDPQAHCRQWAIVALFPPAFVLYQMDASVRYIGCSAVVIAQLLLTFPLSSVRACCRRFLARVCASARHFDEIVLSLLVEPVRRAA
jgi:hypothetical protein